MTQENETGIIVIPVPAGRASFRGSLVAEVSSRIDEESEKQERFTVIRLFSAAEGSIPGCRYVISSIGRSVRYHTIGSECNLGTPVTVGWLQQLPYYDKLTECRRCHAPDIDDLEPDEQVAYEKDRVNPVVLCTDAAHVRERLHEKRQETSYERDHAGHVLRTVKQVRYLSAVAEKLLYAAEAVDPAFAAIMSEIRPLGDDMQAETG